MTPAEPKERGRPSVYTTAIAAEICARLANGETLRAICRDDHMPNERTVRGWALDNHEGFFPQYAKAREIGYHGMAEHLLEIADDGRNDTMRDEEGNVRTDHDVIARSRLRVDTRKWLLSKCLPKVYGDKTETTNKVQAVDENGEPLPVTDLSRHVAFLLASGMKAQEAQPETAVH